MNESLQLRQSIYELQGDLEKTRRSYEVLSKIITKENLDDAIYSLVAFLEENWQFDYFGVQLVDEEEKVLRYYKSYGLDLKNEDVTSLVTCDISLASYDSVSSFVALHKVHVYSDLTKTSSLEIMSEIDRNVVERLGLKENLIVPIVHENKSIAIMHLGATKKALGLSKHDISEIKTVMSSVSGILSLMKRKKDLESLKKLNETEIELARKIFKTIEVDELIEILVSEIKKLHDFDVSNLFLLTEDKSSLLLLNLKMDTDDNYFSNSISNNLVPLQAQVVGSICMNINDIILVDKEKIDEYGEQAAEAFAFWKVKYGAFIPFSRGDEVIGFLSLFNYDKQITQLLSEEIKAKIELFIGPVKNALIYRKLKQKEKEVDDFIGRSKRVFEIAAKINSLSSIEEIYSIIITEINTLFGFDIGSIFTHNETENTLDYICSHVSDESLYSDTLAKLDKYLRDMKSYNAVMFDGAPSVAFLNNMYVYFKDVPQLLHMPMSEKDRKYLEVLNIPQTLLIIPIRKNDKPVSVLCFFSLERQVDLSDKILKVMEALCAFIGTAINNSILYSLVEEQRKKITLVNAKLEEKDRLMSEDLYLAKRIQQSIFSSEHESVKELDFEIYFHPMIEVGGDIYDIFGLKSGFYRLFIADATGHGVQAALMTMLIKTEYDKIKALDLPPNMILKLLNNDFITNYSVTNDFFTCAILDIDTANKKIYYSAAGHPDQLLIRENKVEKLDAGGKIIGVLKDCEYLIKEEAFDKGDKLILYTDGLFEVFSEEGFEMGIDNLYDIVDKHKNKKLPSLVSSVIKDINKWRGNTLVGDDVTLIGISYKKY
jgi:serine phosphatase RsbU (regulator of sigma subunit)/GAF domain-containing protein